MGSDADFADLGDMEIENAGDIFRACEFIRSTASNSGLIIMQWASDVDFALQSIPIMGDRGGVLGIGQDNPQKRARRVARHAFRSAEAMRTVAESAAKLPPAYLKTYQDIIQRRKRKNTFDPRKGL